MQTIYIDGTASILVNGHLTPSFSLQCGVWQGCPLAPYLYIIAHKVLAITLGDPSRLIEGICLPSSTYVLNLSFTDDSTLYLANNLEKLNRAKQVVDDICLASRSLVN
jgi:hypothetical protein